MKDPSTNVEEQRKPRQKNANKASESDREN